jgi:hypothetical protein
MKEYRVKPEFINQILLNRLTSYLRVLVFALVIVIPYLYYFHPRRGPYGSWSDFFSSPSTKITGAFFGIAALFGLIWGIYIGRKSLLTLVVALHDDHITWNALQYPPRQIYYNDLQILKDTAGLTLSSKVNRKITLKVPRQIDDFAELETLLKKFTQ